MFPNIDLTGKICIIGVGNRFKSDDGVGSLIAESISENLRSSQAQDKLVIDAGTVPENYIGRIIRFNPDIVIFIDAIKTGGKDAGEIQFVEYNNIVLDCQSTHGISLKMIAESIIAEINPKIYILGIEVENTALAEGLGERVSKAKEGITTFLKEKLCTN